MKMYGNLTNRIEENVKNEKIIKIDDDITMYLWSDRTCYYVTDVINQKHIKVKEYNIIADKEKADGIGHQEWLYLKEDTYREEEWVYRYKKWYRKEKGINGEINYNTLQGKIRFGVRDYYYDWEF